VERGCSKAYTDEARVSKRHCLPRIRNAFLIPSREYNQVVFALQLAIGDTPRIFD
jgi:hypothetical protein